MKVHKFDGYGGGGYGCGYGYGDGGGYTGGSGYSGAGGGGGHGYGDGISWGNRDGNGKGDRGISGIVVFLISDDDFVMMCLQQELCNV